MTGSRTVLQVDETIEVEAPVERVWRALAEPDLLAAWWDGMSLDLRAGGRFVERWIDEHGRRCTTSGAVETCEPPQHAVLSWADDDWSTSTWVEITVESLGRLRSLLRVRHVGWERFADGVRLAAAHRDGWRHHLENWARAASQVPDA
jgi:uncharacterized protein YndB with AHSA1/START domain